MEKTQAALTLPETKEYCQNVIDGLPAIGRIDGPFDRDYQENALSPGLEHHLAARATLSAPTPPG